MKIGKFSIISTILSVGVLCALLSSLPALAGEPRLMTKYGDWDTYKFTEGNDKVCYMATKAKLPGDDKRKMNESHLGKLDNARVAYAIITNRPSDGTRNVFSYLPGYSYKSGTEVTVDIDGQKFMLFTQADTAWTQDSDTDNKITKAIKSGKSMTVKGTNAAGKTTNDKISLNGSGSAYDAISRECN